MRFSKTTYGQKGGEGSNTGKTATVYEGQFNGRTYRKRVFDFDQPQAHLYFYRWHNQWFCNTVVLRDTIGNYRYRHTGEVIEPTEDRAFVCAVRVK